MSSDLKRVIINFNLLTIVALPLGTVVPVGALYSGFDYLIPSADVYTYFAADDGSYIVRLAKNSENRVIAFRVIQGTVPTNTTIKIRLEYTYGVN